MKKVFLCVILTMISLVIFTSCNSGGNAELNEDLVIKKSEISSEAKYFPIEVDGTRMEVFAVKASDGSIRTAFNTCQVCNGSPRAYFEQNNDVMVCQNCGNQFSLDMIEKEKGGCNPIPITDSNKVDDGENISIKLSYIKENAGKFPDNWKQ